MCSKNSGETVHFLFPVYYKGHNSGTAKWERCKGWAERCSEFPCSPQACHLQHSQLEAIWTPSSRDLIEVSLHSHNGVNPWPLVMNSISSPSPLTEDQRGPESSDPLIASHLSGHQFPFWSHLKLLAIGHPISMQKDITLEIPKA
jgi:hypothetical protein